MKSQTLADIREARSALTRALDDVEFEFEFDVGETVAELDRAASLAAEARRRLAPPPTGSDEETADILMPLLLRFAPDPAACAQILAGRLTDTSEARA